MSDTTPPLSLSEQTKVRLPLLMLIAIVAATVSATIAWSAIRADVTGATRTLAVHEDRIKELEKASADLAVIKNDVRWLRLRAEGRTPSP